MTIPRFVYEYGSYKIKQITGNKLMNAGIKLEILRRIHRAVEATKGGFLTVDECMKLLAADCCTDGENMEQYMV